MRSCVAGAAGGGDAWPGGQAPGRPCEALAEVLGATMVEDVDLSRNAITGRGGGRLAHVIGQTCVQTLLLAHNALGKEGCAAFEDLGPVKQLDLSANQIGDEGCSSVAKLLRADGCHHLALRQNEISDDGARALARMLKHLVDLDISENAIADEGAECLAACLGERLTRLNMRFNQVGDDGAIALARSLCNNSSVRVLILSDNAIGDDGVTALAAIVDCREKPPRPTVSWEWPEGGAKRIKAARNDTLQFVGLSPLKRERCRQEPRNGRSDSFQDFERGVRAKGLEVRTARMSRRTPSRSWRTACSGTARPGSIGQC